MPAKSTKSPKTPTAMSAAEKQAIKERALELKAQAKGQKGEAEVEAKWKLMKPENRLLAQAIHKLVKAVDQH